VQDELTDRINASNASPSSLNYFPALPYTSSGIDDVQGILLQPRIRCRIDRVNDTMSGRLTTN